MPFFKIAHTYAERKKVIKFWEEMRDEAEKIYNEYTDDKDNKYHTDFYKKLIKKKDKVRPDFFEPIYSNK